MSVNLSTASTEITAIAGEIFTLRARLSPALTYLIEQRLADGNRDFFELDKRLWDLGDLLLRNRARLESEDYDPQEAINQARAATAELSKMLARVDEFSSRPWWSNVEFADKSTNGAAR